MLDDSWQVVAIHHGYKKVDPALYDKEAGKSEMVKYHNEGIVISDIIVHIPMVIQQEISIAQGWT